MKFDITCCFILTPFRYDSAESELVTEFATAAKDSQIVISNGGSVETPLTIELIPLTTMNDVTITHVESGYSMRVADTLLTKPATLLLILKPELYAVEHIMLLTLSAASF